MRTLMLLMTLGFGTVTHAATCEGTVFPPHGGLYNGTYDLIFEAFGAGEEPIWSRTATGVAVDEGAFSFDCGPPGIHLDEITMSRVRIGADVVAQIYVSDRYQHETRLAFGRTFPYSHSADPIGGVSQAFGNRGAGPARRSSGLGDYTPEQVDGSLNSNEEKRTPPPGDGVAIVSIRTHGDLAESVLQEVIGASRNQFRYCYQREMRLDPLLQGQITATLIVTADRAAPLAIIQSSTIRNAAVDICVSERLMRMDLPVLPEGAYATASVVLDFGVAL